MLKLIENTSLIYINMNNNAYKKINLSNSINYLTNKYHTRLDSISNELTPEDLTHLGM